MRLPFIFLYLAQNQSGLCRSSSCRKIPRRSLGFVMMAVPDACSDLPQTGKVPVLLSRKVLSGRVAARPHATYYVTISPIKRLNCRFTVSFLTALCPSVLEFGL
jgi:hypothetical protein